MKIAQIPVHEKSRINTLLSFEILDTSEESDFDELTEIAAQICGSPISLISLVDEKRQWFKSHRGLSVRETPREVSFCAHMVFEEQALLVEDARQDDRFFDNPLVTGEPHVVFYAGFPLKSPNGHIIGSLCVIDREPKKLSPQQLRQLEVLSHQVMTLLRLRKKQKRVHLYQNKFEKLAAQVPGVIYQFKLTPDGKSLFPFVTDKIEDVYEYKADEIRWDASQTVDRIHPDDRESAFSSMMQSKGTLTDWNHDYRVILPKKGLRWLRAKAKPEKQDDGSVVFNGFIWDVTDEKNNELMLQQKSRFVALGELSGSIAHEINNPLTVIAAVTAALPRLIDKPEKFKSKLESIDRSVKRIEKIVSGLRKIARVSGPELHQAVTLKKVIEESVYLTEAKARGASVALTVQYNTDGVVKGDEIELEQILINLINNAVDAVKNQSEKWVRISLFEDHEFVVLQVKDSGPGIPEELRKKMFHSFFTTKPVGEGTGLGLSIVHGILKEHGATIEILDKDPNTCFEIRFKKAFAASSVA